MDTFNVEIAATDRPAAHVIGLLDSRWTRHTPIEEFPAVKRIYQLWRSDNVQNTRISTRSTITIAKAANRCITFLQRTCNRTIRL